MSTNIIKYNIIISWYNDSVIKSDYNNFIHHNKLLYIVMDLENSNYAE